MGKNVKQIYFKLCLFFGVDKRHFLVCAGNEFGGVCFTKRSQSWKFFSIQSNEYVQPL